MRKISVILRVSFHEMHQSWEGSSVRSTRPVVTRRTAWPHILLGQTDNEPDHTCSFDLCGWLYRISMRMNLGSGNRKLPSTTSIVIVLSTSLQTLVSLSVLVLILYTPYVKSGT